MTVAVVKRYAQSMLTPHGTSWHTQVAWVEASDPLNVHHHTALNFALSGHAGSLLTAELALKHGQACNTEGDTHHAYLPLAQVSVFDELDCSCLKVCLGMQVHC